MADLLPCPFCGGPVDLEQTIDGRKWWGVVCRNTHNRGGTCAIQQRASASEEAAVARWNMRAAPPPAGAQQAVADGSTPGLWRVEKRERDGELVACWVAAPDCNGFAYDAEILGDDEYRDGDEAKAEGMARRLADCELIVKTVNAHRAALAAPVAAQGAVQPVDCARCKGVGAVGDHNGERAVEISCDHCGGTGLDPVAESKVLGDDHKVRAEFESLANANSAFGLRRSRRGTYLNASIARDWKWFQLGALAATPAPEAVATIWYRDGAVEDFQVDPPSAPPMPDGEYRLYAVAVPVSEKQQGEVPPEKN